jgi:acylphosphatase
MKTRAHIFVSGRVQGVFFRDHTRRWASSLSLTGWVRNIGSGQVEAVAEGDKEKIEELISKLNEGPPLAQVEKVDVSWEEFKGEFKDFRVTFSDFW